MINCLQTSIHKRHDIGSSLRALQQKEQRSAKYFASATSTTSTESSTSNTNTPQDRSATPPRDVAFEPGTTFLQTVLPVAQAQGTILN